MKQTQFAIDVFDNVTFEGFTENREWNGWACPYFTLEQGEKVAEAHKRFVSNAWYDQKSDAFNFQMDDDDVESYESVEIDGQKFYPIGNGCWIWREANDQ